MSCGCARNCGRTRINDVLSGYLSPTVCSWANKRERDPCDTKTTLVETADE